MTDFADPQIGLRRRHQAGLFQPSESIDEGISNNNYNNDDDDDDNETLGDTSTTNPVEETVDTGGTSPRRDDGATTIRTQQPIVVGTGIPLAEPILPRTNNNHGLGEGSSNVTISRWYSFLSTILMVLAIVIAPPSSDSPLSSSVVVDHTHQTGNLSKLAIDDASQGMPNGRSGGGATTSAGENRQRGKQDQKELLLESDSDDWTTWILSYLKSRQEPSLDEIPVQNRGETREGSNDRNNEIQGNKQSTSKPWWARFGKPQIIDSRSDLLADEKYSRYQSFVERAAEWTPIVMRDFFREARYQRYVLWVDPLLLHPTSTTTTDIIDKVLKSTPRLLTIANFMLSMTYLLHSAVAVFFLGPQHPQQGHTSNNRNNVVPNQQQNLPPGMVVDWSPSSTGARERMGGFLVFKLLLISAVVAPDTLDLLILLTWYTWLSCLRSLDHLAHTTTTHLVALGHSPRNGAVQLLFLVLGCDIVAAASCVALFHAAGLDMVLLLTCDCALLAADVLSHILKFLQCVLDDLHVSSIRGMEARQLELHTALRSNGEENVQQLHDAESSAGIDLSPEAAYYGEGIYQRRPSSMTNIEVQQESRGLDRRMEALELAHSKRLAILDSVVFSLDLICHLLTIAHFCHIWSLHGVQFTLIDGVLALHLHSAVSTACKKIAQRRNVHSIARHLQGYFPNATEEELKKASTAGDVCCICLGTMTNGGHVKKVKCGHLYHTHCLREIVERAQSLHAAKCPLCRASLMDGGSATYQENNGLGQRDPLGAGTPPQQVQPNPTPTNNVDMQMQRGQAGDERALFRFSTETLLPAWLPVPAFSFEVVRRPPIGVQIPPPAPIPRQADAVQLAAEESQPTENIDVADATTPAANPTGNPQQQQQDATETSFLRRLLLLAGAVPMSPEEEARALAQLVDMFPQYERSDLLRELRGRGSAEAVAEAILVGVFSGVPRGE
ncbi:ring finger domain containing protein [Nitzschia inconspicua]|uniref:Ring finger domain containing protein n=1 Tax=Nitzschia inconspicua TaxID=303405 RepID=A0A9K3PH20_9STRA|nr:ring finger domain containing protein [Nitzschia inconspicua]